MDYISKHRSPETGLKDGLKLLGDLVHFEGPLISVFLNDEIIIEARLSTSYGANILVPAFNIQNHVVWGATAMILSELRDVLKTAFENEI